MASLCQYIKNYVEHMVVTSKTITIIQFNFNCYKKNIDVVPPAILRSILWRDTGCSRTSGSWTGRHCLTQSVMTCITRFSSTQSYILGVANRSIKKIPNILWKFIEYFRMQMLWNIFLKYFLKVAYFRVFNSVYFFFFSILHLQR